MDGVETFDGASSSNDQSNDDLTSRLSLSLSEKELLTQLAIFREIFKPATEETFDSDEITGRKGVETKLKELLKENNIPESKSQLEPKIQLILQEKRQELELLANEKAFQENMDQFAKKWRNKISKEVFNKSLDVIEKVIELNKEVQRVNEINMQATINDAVEYLDASIKNSNEETFKKIVEASKLQAITKIKESLDSETSEKAIENFNLRAKVIIEQKQKALEEERKAREDQESRRLETTSAKLKESRKHEEKKPKPLMNPKSKRIISGPLPVASTSSSISVKVMPNGNSNGPLRVEPSKPSDESSSARSKTRLDDQPKECPLCLAERDFLEKSNRSIPAPSIIFPEKGLSNKLAVFQEACKQISDTAFLFHLKTELRQEYKCLLEALNTKEEDVDLFVNTLGHECDQFLEKQGIEDDYKAIRKDYVNDSVDERWISESKKFQSKVLRKEWKNEKFGDLNEINYEDLKKEFHKTLTQRFDERKFEVESILELIDETSGLPGKLLTPLRVYDRANKLGNHLAVVWIDLLKNRWERLTDRDQRSVMLRLKQRLPNVHQQIVGSVPSPSPIYKQITTFTPFIIGTKGMYEKDRRMESAQRIEVSHSTFKACSSLFYSTSCQDKPKYSSEAPSYVTEPSRLFGEKRWMDFGTK